MSITIGDAILYLRSNSAQLDQQFQEVEDKSKGWVGNLGGVLATGIAAGIGAVLAGTLALGGAAWAAGQTFDDAFDKIVVGTGATGPLLAGLETSFKNVFTSIPTDAGTASTVIAELNSRLGLTGLSLENLAKPMLEMTRLLGGDAKTNTELYTRLMGDWSIANDDAASTLDKIFKASQLTGTGVDKLMGQVVQFGAPLRLMGFTLDDSIAMFSKWEKEGVNAELVMGSLRIAAGKFANEGQAGTALVGGGVKNLAEANTQLLELQVKLEHAAKAQEKLNEKGSDAEKALNANKIADYQAQIVALTEAMSKGEFVYETTAKSQSSLRDRLLETFTAIKDNKDQSKALAIAMDVFGARAGPDMAAAIREGRFEFEDLLTALQDSEGAILSTAEKTADLGERMTIMKNKATAALEPLGSKLLDVANVLFDKFAPAVETGLGMLTGFLGSPALMSGIDAITKFVGEVIGSEDPIGNLANLVFSLAQSFGMTDEKATELFMSVIGLRDIFDALTNGLVNGVQVELQFLSGVWTALWTALQEEWAWIQANLMPLFMQVGDILKNTVAGSVQQLAASWRDQLLPDLQAGWAWIQGNLLPLLGQLWTWFAANLPPALQTLSNFWLTVLLPALLRLTDWYLNTAGPIFAQLFTWLQTNIPIALQTLSNFWTTVLLPAIMAVQLWITGTLMPLLAELWTWLQVNVPLALQTLANFWRTVLLPAIMAVWGWMSTVLFPFFTALSTFLGAVFGVAITALAGLWQNVLQPALASVWGFLKDNVFPILQTISNYLGVTFQPALSALAGFINATFLGALGALSGAFDGISGAIQGVTGWLSTMAAKLSSISLPPWLTPGSPTPFELGLRGIADALGGVNDLLPDLNSGLSLGSTLRQAQGAGVGAGSVGGGQLILQFNIDATGSQMGEDRFRKIVEEVLAEAGEMGDALLRLRGG